MKGKSNPKLNVITKKQYINSIKLVVNYIDWQQTHFIFVLGYSKKSKVARKIKILDLLNETITI